ncbi:MAG TPA: gas vesicle protein GvpJ [Candidatus Angelobacter sp.]|nr:gas vesicle protein GvpJ [Candidatus Angelobacter sp.]
MDLHLPITEDLASVLDRVLGKSIVVEAWAGVSLQGVDLAVANAKASLKSAAVYDGYGDQGSWKEGQGFEELFPFWRRDLWTR